MGALDNYTLETAAVSRERERIVALWRQGLSHANRPEAKFDWYYGRNPEGEPLVVFLCHGEAREPVGTASTGRRRMVALGRTIHAGLLLDFVVTPGHRTLFPAMALQREMKRIADAAFETIYGMPNPMSEAAIKRMGFERKGTMVRRVRVLRSAGYLARKVPALVGQLAGPVIDQVRRAHLALGSPGSSGMRAAWMERPDARFDDLWRRCAGLADVIGVRDADFLAWRFVEFPFGQHEFFALVSPDETRLVAYAACEAVGSVLHVHDFLADPAEPSTLPALWRELARAAYHRGHGSVSVSFLGDEAVQRSLADAGFLARSERPFYVSRSSPLAAKGWFVTDADEDA